MDVNSNEAPSGARAEILIFERSSSGASSDFICPPMRNIIPTETITRIKLTPVSYTHLDVYTRQVANLVNQTQDAGFYAVKFDASKLSSGIYFYKIQAGDFNAVKKFMLVK